MRCQYRFKVEGRLKVSFSFPLTLGETTYALECNPAGVITHISTTIPVSDQTKWPKAIVNPAPGVKLDLNLQSPGYDFIRLELRAIEGLLSLYGIRSISIDNSEVTWLPDSAEEKEMLALFSFKRNRAEVPDEELQPLPFDLVARSILVAREAQDIEVALSFYRKGRSDIIEERYIEAIYDFYFMLESVFGEGKSKNQQVKKEFERSSILNECIAKALIDDALIAELTRDPLLHRDFKEKYEGKSAAEVIGLIVEIRGFLHHHTLRRPGIWHPEDHKRFEIDALLLQHICYGVAFELLAPIVFSDSAVKAYQSAFQKAKLPLP